MSKRKPSSKKTELSKKINFEIPFYPQKKHLYIVFSIITILSVLLPLYFINYANSVNHTHGFPLDDPWIHLTFAKNLVEYNSFSYFKNEMATAGSTSPLYTVLLSIGFYIIKNEFVLSYSLGIAFFILSSIFYYRLSSYEFQPENYLAVLCTLLFVVDKWINFISVSGMETTMFIFILIACAYSYKKRNPILLGIFSGLILWTRPDGVAFLAALVIDYLIVNFISKKSPKESKDLILFSKNDLLKIGIIFAAFACLYFIMNLILSGSVLPNTYNAKLTYYSPEYRSRADFLKFEVWSYFTEGAYGIFMIGFIFSILKIAYDFSKKKVNPNFFYVCFIFLLVFIYWYKLPYAHRFGRYMMPIIPFYIIVSFGGFKDLSRLIGTYFNSKQIANGLHFIIIAIVLFFSLTNFTDKKNQYTEECKYINDRQVAAAKWIKDNTKESDVIATHDIGAIGFYSNRKIIDMAGLVTPELINKLLDVNYVSYIQNYMKEKEVTYLAVLREWYRVVNQNPLFSTADQKLPPEVMEVYKYFPDSTHILRGDVKDMIMYSENALNQRAAQQALQVLNKAVNLDPKSSLTYYLTAYAYSLLGDTKNQEKNLLKAIEIFPEYKEALLQLGFIYKNQNNSENAKKYLSKYLELNPNNNQVIEIMKSLNSIDSTKNSIDSTNSK